MAKAAALGKGLSALMGSATKLAAPEPVAEKGEVVRQVPHASIVPSPLQPRKTFRPEELSEMVESIKERGIIQPLIVRLVNGKYELIAGERRWRAAAEARLETLPVIVREASNRDVLELALIENIQRADLSPIEEAEAYARLMKEFTLTQEQVAQQVGKGRAVVANAVRLLTLPEQIRAWIGSGDLSVGHAKVLLSLTTADEQLLAAERVRKENLTVRATERLVESMTAGTRKATGAAPPPRPARPSSPTWKSGCSSTSAPASASSAKPTPAKSRSSISPPKTSTASSSSCACRRGE